MGFLMNYRCFRYAPLLQLFVPGKAPRDRLAPNTSPVLSSAAPGPQGLSPRLKIPVTPRLLHAPVPKTSVTNANSFY